MVYIYESQEIFYNFNHIRKSKWFLKVVTQNISVWPPIFYQLYLFYYYFSVNDLQVTNVSTQF